MTTRTRAVATVALATGLLFGCSTTPSTPQATDELMRKATAERQEWNKLDPQLDAFARRGHGYAFFPEVTKGAAGVGEDRRTGIVTVGRRQARKRRTPSVRTCPGDSTLEPRASRERHTALAHIPRGSSPAEACGRESALYPTLVEDVLGLSIRVVRGADERADGGER